MPQYETWSALRAAEVIEQHRHQEGPCLPVLLAIQERFGHVPSESVTQVAEALNLSRAEVHGVTTFYHDLRAEAPGRQVVKLCRAEACQAVGSEKLEAHAKRRLEIDFHETTPDGAWTLEPAYCLGNCACGPAALVDGKHSTAVITTNADESKTAAFQCVP